MSITKHHYADLVKAVDLNESSSAVVAECTSLCFVWCYTDVVHEQNRNAKRTPTIHHRCQRIWRTGFLHVYLARTTKITMASSVFSGPNFYCVNVSGYLKHNLMRSAGLALLTKATFLLLLHLLRARIKPSLSFGTSFENNNHNWGKPRRM